MKSAIKIVCVSIIIITFLKAQDKKEFNFFGEVKVNITNPLNTERPDELVAISTDLIKNKEPNFNEGAYIIYEGNKEVPSQFYNDDFNCSIILTADFKANETKELIIKYLSEGKLKKNYRSRTYAEIAMKFDAIYQNNKFNGDRFENFTKVIVPDIHTDHDALFKYEGPGWESEKVGYRFYLDWRNSTDIFGKKINKLVLDEVGTNDVFAKDDSYHVMQSWGMDIFKVGSTLGIGSIGMMKDEKIEMVSQTEQVTCEISFNGPILSEVLTNYNEWMVGEEKFDLISKLSISAGSRITKVNLKIYGDPTNITTGFAKYPGTEFLKSSTGDEWQYIALYGKQTLADDNLGIVLYYKKSNLIKQGEDNLNYFVSIKPDKRKVEYAYAAAWEQEPDGINNINEFQKYINEEMLKLNNPVAIVIN